MASLHQRAKDVFVAVLARPPAERLQAAAALCGDDEELRREVESLLEFHEESAGTPPGPVSPGRPGSAGAHGAADPVFAPGEIFAGRYRMIARVGRGGMGDVWRADDLVLNTEVALKLIEGAGADARERIVNEVRLARQITHPAVCRVFDVGEANGVHFYSMEFVRGEDLAALIRRVGRLPSEKVVDIARQLCAGLAAMHAQGVLHRDLKPANVLIDNDGAVRITDFGIAIPRDDAERHRLTGTPAYMAPEQRMLGVAISERTDVYALGLILYELMVGQRAFGRSRDQDLPEPPRPSMLVPDVDLALERVVMQALSVDPQKRPASVGELAAKLPDIDTRPSTGRAVAPTVRLWARRPAWIAAAGLAAIVALLVIASTWFVAPGSRTLTEQDTIVLADFENTTGDSVFDGTLKVALAVALEQSPFIRIFPDERARETLRLMQRSPDERVTRAIAREIARREQLKALIAATVGSLGRNYVLALEAINAQTGDVMAREQAEARTKEEVLTALGTATSRLRQKLGESLASVQQFDTPLARATTSSLEALHAYSLALYEGREVPRLEAIPYLKRAIELDPNFAMAHAQLSAVYANTGQTSLAPEYSIKAFQLRDRVSDRERFYISWRYYRDAIQAWDKGLELARSWTATYPREGFAFNALAVALIRLGQFEASLAPLRESLRLDPKFVPAYGNLAASLLAVNRPAEARAVLQDADNRKLDFPGARRLSYLLAFVEGDRETMTTEFEASIGVRENNSAYGWEAHSAAFEGRIATAHEHFRRGIQMSLQGRFNEVAAQLTMEDAETHAIVGQCAEARNELTAGLQLNRDNSTIERASRISALCGAAAEALTLSNEAAKRFPEATLTNRLAVPVIAAILALGRHEPQRAIQILDPVRPYDHAPSAEFWPLYLRGQAYLALKDGPSAAAQFRSILDRRGEVPTSALYPLAHLGLARAAALAGDPGTARQAYDNLFKVWSGADADLAPLKDARLEYARLD